MTTKTPQWPSSAPATIPAPITRRHPSQAPHDPVTTREDPHKTTRPCRIPNCPRNAAPHRHICHTHKNHLYRHADPHLKLRNLTHPEDIPPVVENRLPDHGLTITDRRTAARLLTEQGASAAEIAALIGVTERTVYRWRAERFRQPA